MNKTDKRIADASKRIHTYIDNLWNEYFSRREAEKTIDTYKRTGMFYNSQAEKTFMCSQDKCLADKFFHKHYLKSKLADMSLREICEELQPDNYCNTKTPIRKYAPWARR